MLNISKKILSPLLIVTTLFIFFLTRSAELLSRNYVFVLDQGRDYVAISEMIANHKITLIGSEIGGGYAGFSGIFQGPFHYYFLSIFYVLFQGDPYGGIVYMFLFACFALIASYFVARKIFHNSLVALCVSLLVAISPPIISQAKYTWNPHPISVFIVLIFLFLYLSYNGRKKYIFLTGLVASFTYNFEIASTVPIVLAILIYYVFVLRLKSIKQYGVLVVGGVLGMLPFFLFEVRHNFMAFNGFVAYVSTPGKDEKSGYSLVNNHLDSFIYNFGDTFSYQTSIPVLLPLILFFLILAYLLRREKRKEVKTFQYFLLILIGTTLFVLSFLRNHIFMYYLYQLNFVYIFLFGYILYASVIQKKKYITYAFACVLIVLSIYSINHGIKDFTNDYYDYGGSSKIKGKKEAVDFIYKDAQGKQFGLFTFAPGVFTYPYDYTAQWYGKNKYGYSPNTNKDGLFYLLIEEDKYIKQASKGWMETVIKTGEIVKTTKLKSGLVVQKRYGK